jgi:WD40 repeat protein
VFALIVDGMPYGLEDECFPDALKRTAAGGAAEPLAVDVRKFGREDAALRLIAGILDVGYDDLRQREARRRRAEMLRAQALFVTGMVLVAAALTGGYFAATYYVDASDKKSEIFAREAAALSAEGQHAKAMLMALYGDPAAQAGFVEKQFLPDGYPSLRDNLVSAYSGNLLLQKVDVESETSVLALSPDGRLAAGGFADGSIKIWNVADGSIVSTLIGHRNEPVAAAFSHDGKKVVTADHQEVKLWESKGGPQLATYRAPGSRSFTCVTFTADGTRIWAGSDDGTSTVWLVQTRRSMMTINSRPRLQASSPISSIAISADGDLAITGSIYGTATVWNTSSGEELVTLVGHSSSVGSVAFSPDAKSILTASGDGTAKLWPVTGGDALVTFFDGPHDGITVAAFSFDGRHVLTGSYDGTARLWDAGTGLVLHTFSGHEDEVRSLAFFPDGKRVLSGSSDGALLEWEIPTGRHLLALEMPEDAGAPVLSRHGAKALVWPPYSTQIFDVSDGSLLAKFIAQEGNWAQPKFAFDDSVISIVGSSLSEHAVMLWSPDGATRAAFSGHSAAVDSAALARDGKTLLTGHADGTVRLWSAAGGEALLAFTGHEDRVTEVAFSPDGSTFLTGSSDGTAKLWPASGGEAQATFTGHIDGVSSVSFSPDGSTVLTGAGDGTATLWSTKSGRVQVTFFGDGLSTFYGSHSSAVFSKSGNSVITVSRGGVVREWVIEPIIHANKHNQVRMACAKLKEIGVTKFSSADYVRFPILDRDAPHPCEKVWADAES